MKAITYEAKIWALRHEQYEPTLLQLLTSKDHLVILKHGKPPYQVVLGVPHQAKIGEGHICEDGSGPEKNRASDENAASYALVAFSLLKEHDIPCKLVVAAHPTAKDPNKHADSPYCQELFREPGQLVLECHGAKPSRQNDIEIAVGSNKLTDPVELGRFLSLTLQRHYVIGIQKEPGKSAALIISTGGLEEGGKLELPATETKSLTEAGKHHMQALHIEAKPAFRIPQDKTNTVPPDGFILGKALAELISAEWVKKELEKVEQSYKIEVRNMVGAYHREIERKKEYQGRQLLELLQNADDEAEQLDNPRILIRLEQNRLVVANDGLPFTTQGLLSLMYSDNSPKIKRQKKIGYKGLGFRAILNWSDSIWIKSGAFSFEFSRNNAVGFLTRLLETEPRLKEEIQKTGAGDNPIATLSIPTWKPAHDFGPAQFSTYVVINFTSEEVRKNIQAQISELGLEVALFLNNLKQIRLESPTRNETILRLPPQKGDYEEVQLIDDKGQVKNSKSWRIFKKSDDLPENLRSEAVKQYEYDLRIAVSKTLDDRINRLFTYFKTEVKLPFPAIIHGTFELDGNRNHITETKVNEFLLERLAQLMVETAMQLSQAEGRISWDAMKLLARKGELDDKLEKMGFQSKLLESIKAHKLIPVLSNKYMAANENPSFYDFPLAEILKATPSEFPELTLYTSDADIQALLRELGIGNYQPEDLVKRLNKVSPALPPELRAELIILLVDHYDECLIPLQADKMPRLFVDDQGQVIGANTKALLPPEGAKFSLPEAVRLFFISTGLAKHLRAKAGAKTNRDLATKLVSFNVLEYSAATGKKGTLV